MDVYSWIFVIVFGSAFIAAITAGICKYIYEKRMIKMFSKACNFTSEEQETYKKMLKEASVDTGISIFELFE